MSDATHANLLAEALVERVGGGAKELLDRGEGEMAGGDAAVALENGVQGEPGAAREARLAVGGGDQLETLLLREAGGRDGGGEGVEIHRRRIDLGQWVAWYKEETGRRRLRAAAARPL